MTPSTDTRSLSPPVSEMDRLLDNRARAERLLTDAFGMIAEATALTPGFTERRVGVSAELRSAHWYGIEKPDRQAALLDECLRHFDRKAWWELLTASRMADVMSHQDKDAYLQQLNENPPALTRESVIGTFTELFGNRNATWRRGVAELFAGLSGNYRSHDPFKVGRRLVLEHAFNAKFGGWSHYTHANDKVDDLQRVIALIEGHDPPEERWSVEIDRVRREGGSEHNAGPVLFRCFKNGSLHIWLQERGLIDRINDVIAEHYGATLADARKRA